MITQERLAEIEEFVADPSDFDYPCSDIVRMVQELVFYIDTLKERIYAYEIEAPS
jgi:hypothetical protein